MAQGRSTNIILMVKWIRNSRLSATNYKTRAALCARVSSSTWFGVWSLGFGAWSSECGVWGLEFEVWGLGYVAYHAASHQGHRSHGEKCELRGKAKERESV